MAQQLWLLRHGDAVPHGSRPDSERELTPKGERQATDAGRALARMGIELDGVYSSPKTRARQTAERACVELGRSFEEASLLAAGFDADDARELLIRHDDGACVLVVGHEPDFSQVVLDLTGARIDLEKGGAACVSVSGRAGELVSLLRPAELEVMAS